MLCATSSVVWCPTYHYILSLQYKITSVLLGATVRLSTKDTAALLVAFWVGAIAVSAAVAYIAGVELCFSQNCSVSALSGDEVNA